MNGPVDTDGDGVGDNADEFPDDPNESEDTDGDGVGDNGCLPLDTDEPKIRWDGVGDNLDVFQMTRNPKIRTGMVLTTRTPFL